MNKNLKLFFIIVNIILHSCGGKGTTHGINNVTEKYAYARVNISTIDIQSNQFVLTGTDLDTIIRIQMIGDRGVEENLEIESKTSDTLIANGIKDFTISNGYIYNIMITDAYGTTSYAVTFPLSDGSVTAEKLDQMNANDGDVLTWDNENLTWTPIQLSGLNYQGTWDVAGNSPDLSLLSSPNSGDYYFVSASGAGNLPGISSWDQGDWAMFNGSAWQKVDNSTLVPSVFGREGAIVAQTNDYTWEQIDKNNSTLGGIADVYIPTTPNDGQYLGWNDTHYWWEAKTFTIAVSSITSSELANDSVNSFKVLDGSLTNADFAANAAIDYSKLNIASGDLTIAKTNGLQAALNSKVSISSASLGANLNMNYNNINNIGTINGFDIAVLDASVSANTANLTSLNTANVSENTTSGGLYFTETRARTAAVADTITDAITNIAPSQNAVFDALALKQDLVGGTTDLSLNSVTTNSQNGIVIGPYGTDTGETGELQLKELSPGTNYVGFKAPDSIASDIVWTLPNTVGTNGQLLTNLGNRILSWEDPTGGGGFVIGVTGTSPINSSGGTVPNISISQASSTTGGYLSSTDWNSFNDKMEANSNLTTIGGLSTAAGNFIVGDGVNWTAEASAAAKISLGLGNVENTALSTWAGSTNITTLGTINNGTWQGSNIGIDYLSTGGNWSLSSDLNIDSNTLVIDYDNDRVGIGTSTPTSKMTVEGVLSLREVSSPEATLNYGKIYASSSDSKLYYKDSSGNETDLMRLTAYVEKKNSNYTIDITDNNKVFLVSGNTTIVLPDVVTAGDGFTVTIKKTDASNTVTIDGDGGETIDGNATSELQSQYAYETIICDGSEWFIIAQYGAIGN